MTDNFQSSSTAIIVRATTLDERTRHFAEELRQASGHDVLFVLDARFASDVKATDIVLSLSEAHFKNLGVYTPPRFAWMCGDYCFYLARRAYPAVKRFWLIEYDVRIVPQKIKKFFAPFEDETADLVGIDLRQADGSWFWFNSARAKDAKAYRCLFPVVRLSDRAIDAAFTKRKQHTRRWLRRLIWANDESFIATTLCNANLTWRDLRAIDQTAYDLESFNFDQPIRGETYADTHWDTALLHPVLFGEAYARKLVKLGEMATPKPWERRWRRVMGALTSRTRW